MTIETRRPTGKPSWPILLMAGREGTGKSWSAAEASASDLVSRTLWVGVGEDAPDEYSLIPGADFEIVKHDGTYKDILRVCHEIAALPVPDDGPILFVFDSGSRLWVLLSDMAQQEANTRARKKNSSYSGDAQITVDLWNVAAARWNHIFDTFRAHRGPVVITARLEQVAIMANGQPTAEKQWKVLAHKFLPYDVSGIVEMQERGSFLVTKIKSARIKLAKPTQYPNFTIDALWRSLGLAEVQAGPRAHDTPALEPEADDEAPLDRDWEGEAKAAPTAAAASKIGAAAAVVLGKDHDTVEAIRLIVAAKRGEPAEPEHDPSEPTEAEWAEIRANEMAAAE